MMTMEQENADESKMGNNWKPVAIVVAILLVGAVMGHSLLTNERVSNQGDMASSACQGCPTSKACSAQAASAEKADMACALGDNNTSCAQKGTCAATDEAKSNSSCCGEKSTVKSCTCETAPATSACGGCPSSKAAQ